MHLSKPYLVMGLVALISIIFTAFTTQACSPIQSPIPAPVPAPVPPTGGDTPLAPTTGEPEPATPLQIEVLIQESTYIPDTQNIPAGALVLWYNDDSVDHTVTARDDSFDSGRISPNETFEYIFEQPGEVEYYCKIHPSMVGKIIIE